MLRGRRRSVPQNTVEQAAGLLAAQPIDAAILDLNLHGDMAVEFVEQLSASGLPCVIVSGYGSGSLPESLRAIPSIEKPARYESVISCLAGQISRQSGAA